MPDVHVRLFQNYCHCQVAKGLFAADEDSVARRKLDSVKQETTLRTRPSAVSPGAGFWGRDEIVEQNQLARKVPL